MTFNVCAAERAFFPAHPDCLHLLSTTTLCSITTWYTAVIQLPHQQHIPPAVAVRLACFLRDASSCLTLI
jgi:hypothetical protein